MTAISLLAFQRFPASSILDPPGPTFPEQSIQPIVEIRARIGSEAVSRLTERQSDGIESLPAGIASRQMVQNLPNLRRSQAPFDEWARDPHRPGAPDPLRIRLGAPDLHIVAYYIL
jgi:hypothetical protein